MSALMERVCLNTSEAVMACSYCMHRLVIAEAWDRVDAVAGLTSFGVVHLRAAGITGVLLMDRQSSLLL